MTTGALLTGTLNNRSLRGPARASQPPAILSLKFMSASKKEYGLSSQEPTWMGSEASPATLGEKTQGSAQKGL